MARTFRPDRRAFLSALAAAPFALSAGGWGPGPLRKIALTFDDLPYAGRPSPGPLADAQRATAGILKTLELWRAPAIGFVNAAGLDVPGETEARTALLRAWVDGGLDLGNHTSSHLDLDDASIQAFEADIDRGDRVIRTLLERRGLPLRYFRYPFNHTGRDLRTKQAIEMFLAARGYRIAPFTIDSGDEVFNLPYVEALKAGDRGKTEVLGRAYIDFVLAATRFAQDVAPRIFEREIPQVMLLHANDLNADWLYPLLRRLMEEGYSFITLDEAMADPAYSTPDLLVTSSGPSWLWRWRQSRSLDISFTGDPEPPPEVMQAYQRISAASAKRWSGE